MIGLAHDGILGRLSSHRQKTSLCSPLLTTQTNPSCSLNDFPHLVLDFDGKCHSFEILLSRSNQRSLSAPILTGPHHPKSICGQT